MGLPLLIWQNFIISHQWHNTAFDEGINSYSVYAENFCNSSFSHFFLYKRPYGFFVPR